MKVYAYCLPIDMRNLESALLNDLNPRDFVEYAVKRQIIPGQPTLPWSQSI